MLSCICNADFLDSCWKERPVKAADDTYDRYGFEV